MMMPAPPTLTASPYSSASGVTTPTLHPAMPQLDAAYAAAAAANLQAPAKDTTWTKLFVGGLPYTTTDQELKEFFEEFGEIEEAAVIIDRQTGKSKGYGFVTMADTKAAARAVQNPNPVIQGRKSNVNYAFIGAKHNYHSNRGTATSSVAASSGDEQNIYAALMSPEAYASAATATTMRYAAFLPPQYGAKGALRTKIMRGPGSATALAHRPIAGPYRAANATAGAAGAMMYTPASPYSAMMPTAMPLPTATAATQGQHMLAGAYPAATAYDYNLAVPSSGAGATTTLPPQYFYPQVIDPSQYMAMASLQGTHLTTAAAPGSAGTMMPSMYQGLVPSSAAVSGAVTSVSAALPAAAAPALSAGSYPAIQEQR